MSSGTRQLRITDITRIVTAADEFEAYLAANSGPTADWDVKLTFASVEARLDFCKKADALRGALYLYRKEIEKYL